MEAVAVHNHTNDERLSRQDDDERGLEDRVVSDKHSLANSITVELDNNCTMKTVTVVSDSEKQDSFSSCDSSDSKGQKRNEDEDGQYSSSTATANNDDPAITQNSTKIKRFQRFGKHPPKLLTREDSVRLAKKKSAAEATSANNNAGSNSLQNRRGRFHQQQQRQQRPLLPRASSFKKPRPKNHFFQVPARSVSFNDKPNVRSIPSVPSLLEFQPQALASIWYDKYEMETTKEEANQIVLEAEASKSTTSSNQEEETDSLRGLERQTEQGSMESFHHRLEIYEAVLDYEATSDDGDSVASRASKATEKAKEIALKRAQQDALDAQKYLYGGGDHNNTAINDIEDDNMSAGEQREKEVREDGSAKGEAAQNHHDEWKEDAECVPHTILLISQDKTVVERNEIEDDHQSDTAVKKETSKATEVPISLGNSDITSLKEKDATVEHDVECHSSHEEPAMTIGPTTSSKEANSAERTEQAVPKQPNAMAIMDANQTEQTSEITTVKDESLSSNSLLANTATLLSDHNNMEDEIDTKETVPLDNGQEQTLSLSLSGNHDLSNKKDGHGNKEDITDCFCHDEEATQQSETSLEEGRMQSENDQEVTRCNKITDELDEPSGIVKAAQSLTVATEKENSDNSQSTEPSTTVPEPDDATAPNASANEIVTKICKAEYPPALSLASTVNDEPSEPFATAYISEPNVQNTSIGVTCLETTTEVESLKPKNVHAFSSASTAADLNMCVIPQVSSNDSAGNLEEGLTTVETGSLVGDLGTNTVEKEIERNTDKDKKKEKTLSSTSCRQHSKLKASESKSQSSLQLHVHAALQESGKALSKGKNSNSLEKRPDDDSKGDKRKKQARISKGAKEQTLSPTPTTSSTTRSSINGKGRLPLEPERRSTCENRQQSAIVQPAAAAVGKVSASHATMDSSGPTNICNNTSVATKSSLQQTVAKSTSTNISTDSAKGLRLPETNCKRGASSKNHSSLSSGKPHPNGLKISRMGTSSTLPTGSLRVEDPLPRQQRSCAEPKERKKRRSFLPGSKISFSK